jgi:hypothetical protein
MCKEALEVRKAAMASQVLAELVELAAVVSCGMYLWKWHVMQPLTEIREEQVDSKDRCTANCIGKATSLVSRNRQDPMSDSPRNRSEACY